MIFYERILQTLWDLFQISVSEPAMLDGIEDDSDLELLVSLLRKQQESGESLNLQKAVKTVVMEYYCKTEEEYNYAMSISLRRYIFI